MINKNWKKKKKDIFIGYIFIYKAVIKNAEGQWIQLTNGKAYLRLVCSLTEC